MAFNVSLLKEPYRRFLLEVWIVAGVVIMLAAALYALFARQPQRQSSAKPQSAPAPQADADSLTCTCAEWQQSRSRFRQGDPRRLCVHLCSTLAQDMLLVPQHLLPFSQLIARMHAEERGMPYAIPTFAFVLGDSGYLITITPESRPWATVYVGGADYAFDVDSGQWDESGRPPFASDIGSLIQSEIRRRSQKQPAPESTQS